MACVRSTLSLNLSPDREFRAVDDPSQCPWEACLAARGAHMGKLDGKVAFISGAARGQGRSHAVRLAQEGADIIAFDICAQISNVSYEMATPEDLAQTVKEVEAEGRRIVARQADVRDAAAVRAVLDEGRAELGPVGIVLANAGIAAGGQSRGGLGRRHRGRPDRCLEHRALCAAGDDRRRSGRRGRGHQFGRPACWEWPRTSPDSWLTPRPSTPSSA